MTIMKRLHKYSEMRKDRATVEMYSRKIQTNLYEASHGDFANLYTDICTDKNCINAVTPTYNSARVAFAR